MRLVIETLDLLQRTPKVLLSESQPEVELQESKQLINNKTPEISLWGLVSST